MRLYEEPEDFPFEYLCEEDYEIDSEDDDNNKEFFIKSH